ncbi:MAG TPA: hypothetical protein DDW52_28350, partial [Planctomycetaceae bacterium]|nr:hypothetical protein [Planctomycetaceae bacterium]
TVFSAPAPNHPPIYFITAFTGCSLNSCLLPGAGYLEMAYVGGSLLLRLGPGVAHFATEWKSEDSMLIARLGMLRF